MKIIQLTNMTPCQMMGYVIKAKSGEVIVVDGGAKGNEDELLRVIKKVGGYVNLWLITHPHSDHHDAVINLLSREGTGITYGKICSSVLTDAWADEKKQGDDLKNWNKFVRENAKDSFIELKKGQKFTVGSITVDVISETNPEIDNNITNNQSICFRITEDGFSFLMLGDLGIEGEEKIVGVDLKSDAVQMAHHGQRGVSEDFYKKIKPEFAFWPTPRWLWDNKKYLGAGNLVEGNYKTPENAEWMRKLGAKNIFSFEHTVSFDTETKVAEKI